MVFPEQYRIAGRPGGSGGFCFKKNGVQYRMVASWEEGWEHVSLSLDKKRCPYWEEMCMVKALFWDDSETVIQYHPAKKDYINNHAYCLHLWRPTQEVLPVPPTYLIGLKDVRP